MLTILLISSAVDISSAVINALNENMLFHVSVVFLFETYLLWQMISLQTVLRRQGAMLFIWAAEQKTLVGSCEHYRLSIFSKCRSQIIDVMVTDLFKI